MAWTTPKTWAFKELLTAANLNTHLRDNLLALKSPPSANHEADETLDYSTSSTTFVDVDSTNFSHTITTTGGDVFVHFHGSVYRSGGSTRLFMFDVEVDGVRVGGSDGIAGMTAQADISPHGVAFTRLITGLAAGEHTFVLQWKVNGLAYLSAGGGLAYRDQEPQFWVREIS